MFPPNPLRTCPPTQDMFKDLQTGMLQNLSHQVSMVSQENEDQHHQVSMVSQENPDQHHQVSMVFVQKLTVLKVKKMEQIWKLTNA